MTISKKISMFVFSLLLVVASFLFASCGEKDYSNVTLTASREEVVMFVDDENAQNVTFTINNPVSDMASSLSYTLSNPSICTVSLLSTQNYSTIYAITGIKGGVSDMTVRTNEGNISCTIRINVREYSSNISASDNALYLSLSTELYPSAADFTFSDNTTERDLEFYFYGKVNNSSSLTIEDITVNDAYVNSFIQANLIEINDSQYIIFTDSTGSLYTLGQGVTNNRTQNTFYNFINVANENGEYVFDTTTASEVQAGDKFTFFAVNRVEGGEIIYCQRDFYVIVDIDYESVSHEYGYRIVEREYIIGSDTLHIIEDVSHGGITLVPGYQSTILDGFFVGDTIDFITVYLGVTINSENDLIQVKTFVDDVNVINVKRIGQLSLSGQTTYYFQVDCATGVENLTNLNINFYYEGFENSEDENVNYVYSIPVNIRVIPTNLLINNIDFTTADVLYTFYNNYAGTSFGWQEFLFSINPEDAEYDELVIDLTDTDLQLRYNNTIYQDQVVIIYDLSQPVYIKGVSNATVTEDVQTIPITLNFNVIQEGSLQLALQYEIVQGANFVDFQTEEFADRIYLDLNSQEPVVFLDLYADAQFSNITVSSLSGTNVARFIIDEQEPYIQEGDIYQLNLQIIPITTGTGTYSVILDNGEQTTLTITVLESLGSISIETQNQQNSIRYVEDVEEGERYSTLFYVYNTEGSTTFFDVEVIANNNESSTAITNIQFTTSQLIQIGDADAANNNKNFNVYVRANGSSELQLMIGGYSIVDFKLETITKIYYLDIVAFNYIGNLNVFKESDGEGYYIDPSSTNENIRNYGVNAAYADVYSGTNLASAREAVFNITVNNQDAYLFAYPAYLDAETRTAYVENTFDQSYVYWETDSDLGIQKNSQPVDIMYQTAEDNNVYTIVGLGTFDTSTLTFTAFSNIENPRNFKLIAHVRQYGRVYSYTVNVRISVYEEVNRITLQDSITSIEFTSTERQHSIIAYPTNLTATNGEIVALFEGGDITIENANGTTSTYYMLDENSIDYIESDGRYQIILTVNDEFVTHAENYQYEMEGTLWIAARDWLDDNNNILSDYQSLAINIEVRFANGTEQNRFTIESAEDLINMNLSAHYQINTTIDVSAISEALPLGELQGSIVGTSEYAEITGINIINSIHNGNNNSDYYGLFTSIGTNAYIEYVKFSGEFNIARSDSINSFAGRSRVGLIAGSNEGTLINVGVTIMSSNINVTDGYIGGVVGINNGTIIQDYTLFEENSSNTRSYTEEQLKNVDGRYGVVGSGRYSYAGLTPNILVYMEGTMTVNYIASQISSLTTYVGGVAGSNNGIIEKIDSKVLSYTGYTNYMAYSQISLVPVSFDGFATLTNQTYVGGLTGASSATSSIIGGYNSYQNNTLSFVIYSSYQGAYETATNSDYVAGQGIIVGGQVSGYDYVGGVVGFIDTIGEDGIAQNDFTGITSRTFVRGLLSSVATPTPANVAGIANIENVNTINSAFAMQAVDIGYTGINSSMITLHSTSVISSYFRTTNIANSNKLAFGILEGNTVAVMNGVDGEMQDNINYVNVNTFVLSRSRIELTGSNISVNSLTRTSYYGDFVIVGDNGSTLLAQSFFVEGGDMFLSLNEGFNNKLTAEEYDGQQGLGNKEIYYMFYFAASSTDNSDENQGYQELLDSYMNSVNFNSVLYPFTTNGEMSFTSNTRDILSFDQNGRITVRGTGIANVTATSILNTNNAIEFYIYVINYFNPDDEDLTENSESSSIIYPNGSSNSLPIGDTTINLRGQNSASLYVRPHYTLNMQLSSSATENSRIDVDAQGVAILNNVVFNLATNTVVTAQVTKVQKQVEVTDSETGETTIEYQDASAELDIEVTGQTIVIRRNDLTQEEDYKITITPVVEFTFLENNTQTGEQVNVTYISGVNRELDNVTINYRKGASSINNTKYNNATLLSSRKIEDVIVIDSTAEENLPLYYIVRSDNVNIQGSDVLEAQGFNFLYGSEEFLFDVSFVADLNNSENLSNQRFNLTISVNKNSQAYINRYIENIYGQYTIYILAESNTAIYTSITINFEQTNITSVVVDNYSNLAESTGTVGISSTSNYAYPGTTGLLAITITPDDSDFDYILIENVDENYNTGNASANFGFLARKANTTGEENIFDDKSIVGSATATGLRINLNDIISTYNQTGSGDAENQNIYYTYNGVVYISYDLTSVNVNDESTTSIRITIMKDGEVAYSVIKNLTVRLQNYVSVELNGKTPTSTNEGGFYASYNVARGMRYQLNINSYGYLSSSISAPVLSDDTYATIVEEEGIYYLEITSNTVNYDNEANIFNISITATQVDGDNVRTSSSLTRIVIQEYVLEYNGELVGNSEDIISGMGNGEINVQVGTQTTFSVDIFSHIEYDSTNIEVVNSVEEFMNGLAYNGIWRVATNLISDQLPDYAQADEEGEVYELGYDANGNILSGSNYYFNYAGLNLTPVRTHEPEDRFYYITFYSNYSYSDSTGTYTAERPDTENNNDGAIIIGSQTVHTEFVLNVYSSSSEESPIPIYDYNDLLDMQSGGYYILLNDITLPNKANESQGIEAFSPLVATFKSLDGNGHTISFAGTYDLGSSSSIGLFTTLPEDSIIRNLNINFTAAIDGSDTNIEPDDDYGWYNLRTVKFITTSDAFNFGSIVADNQGIITNCRVTTDTVSGSEYYVVVKADNALDGSSFMGGIAATNSGYITNCAVSINMRTPYNMGGIVGQNSGKIAASYFKNGVIENNSQQSQHVAGFVVTNLESGQIITSYVSGEQSNTSLYSKDSVSSISSTIAAAGFVYQNAGYISDCYTDIDLSKTTSDMAGFVYMNGGEIKNSFSLSVLRNNVTASAGFARYDSYDNNTGTFENCYYLYNEEQESGEGIVDSESGFIIGESDINTSVIPIAYDGIERLNAGGFADVAENFANYSYQNSMGTNAVWFFSNGNTSTTYVDYVPTTQTIDIPGDEGNVQTNTVYETELMTFALNRLELVSPNIAALSIRNFSYSELDANTGEVIYHYIDDSSTPNRGSIHNPRLIYDAATMESEISEQTSASNLNITNYRIISDIDYSTYEELSVLYQTIFAGNLEGNGMEISQISLVSMDSLTNAGLFAQIGYSANNTGTVKNLTIAPSQVAFANTNSVGTLAGTLRYGYIYDVTIDGRANISSEDTGGTVVIGRNFVGGVIGRAINSYSIKNISSNINVSSTYTSSLDATYTEAQTNLTSFSYSGSIAGFMGTGTAYNMEISETSSIQGSRAGFAFGGIGNNANISMVFVDVLQDSIIRAYHYGGYVVGEVSGNLSYVHVSGSQSMESTFSVIPRAANSVGGITGILSGGTISNAVMEQSFRATSVSTSSSTIYNVGGIAGIITNAGNRPSYIEFSIVNADIEGASILGGAVGAIENVLFIDNVAVKSTNLSVVGQKANPYLGGVVGLLSGDNNASLTMTNSYCTSLLTLNTSTSGLESAAFVGGLVGGTENSRVPYLAYCYTTSTVDATVVDNRSIDAVSTYSSFFDAEGMKTNPNATFSYSINNNTSNGNFNHVYYLGHNTSTTATSEAYNRSENYNVTYRTKVLNVAIGLTVNNYGTSSLEYGEEYFKYTNAAMSTGITEDVYYNLFADVYHIPLFASAGTNDENDSEAEEEPSLRPAVELVYDHSNNSYMLGNNILEYNENNGDYVFVNNQTQLISTPEEDYGGTLDIIYYVGNTRYEYGTYHNRTGFWEIGHTSSPDDCQTSIQVTSIEKTLNFAYAIQNIILADSAGNYFEQMQYDIGESYPVLAYRNILTNTVYYQVYHQVDGVTTVSFETADGVALTEIPTLPVWITQTTGLSILAFENELEWLNR